MTQLVLDSSALMAIALGEPDAAVFESAIFAASGALSISSATVLEAMIVAEARHPDSGGRDVRTLLGVFAPTIVPMTADVVEIAFAGWRRFGKGRHPAALNFADCFSYALSKQLGAPLLFKGNDFTQTDVASAL